jgi:2-methylaconitate cis-trans-isomerase PrpF
MALLPCVLTGPLQVSVRIYNTNTQRTLLATLEVDEDGRFLEDGDYTLPGVASTGSRIRMAFEKPAGAMTGRLLPSGQPTDEIEVRSPVSGEASTIRVSLVDAANPFVFIDGASLPESVQKNPGDLPALAEVIRQKGAVLMGLARSMEEASLTRGTPKVAVVSVPADAAAADIRVTAFSMGKVHPSLQLTGAVCLASAACVEGTLPYEIARRAAAMSQGRSSGSRAAQTIRIQHAKGIMAADVRMAAVGVVDSVTLSRTARRLFKGEVCCTI